MRCFRVRDAGGKGWRLSGSQASSASFPLIQQLCCSTKAAWKKNCAADTHAGLRKHTIKPIISGRKYCGSQSAESVPCLESHESRCCDSCVPMRALHVPPMGLPLFDRCCTCAALLHLHLNLSLCCCFCGSQPVSVLLVPGPQVA